MEQYRTEQEQLEALRHWWNENGRSIVAAVVISLAAYFGWQAWQTNELRQQEQASDLYQALLRTIGTPEASSLSPQGIELAERLKSEFGQTTYAQFATLHLAAIAVNDGKLPDAQQHLRWVLEKAENSSATAQVAQLRLARVLAASGDTEQALAILEKAQPGSFGASYAAARGDILLAAGRREQARDAYSQALALASGEGQQVSLPALQQKLQSLTPVPARTLGATTATTVQATTVTNNTVNAKEN